MAQFENARDAAYAAKLQALRDITEDCKKEKHGKCYLPFESEICEMVGISKPDFRAFNGKYTRKKKQK